MKKSSTKHSSLVTEQTSSLTKGIASERYTSTREGPSLVISGGIPLTLNLSIDCFNNESKSLVSVKAC